MSDNSYPFEDPAPGNLPVPDPVDPHRLPERPPTLEFSVEDSPLTRPPRRQAQRAWRFWQIAGIAVIAALLGAGSALAFVWITDEPPDPTTAVIERVETQIVRTESSTSTAAAVAQRVLPSIVTVEVGVVQGSDFISTGSGSGVVIDANGTLVTNDHVVEGAAAVRVVFADGRSYEAQVAGTDALTDLAVIHIDAVGLTPVEIGASKSMAIGDTAIAVGSPLGLAGGPSVTVGVLSAFDRRVRVAVNVELFGMLQTDAPITRGSSGGALVDGDGRLIGITSAIGVSDVGAEGLGFAIPVEMMERITQDILEFGRAKHAFLGITGATHFQTEADGALAPAGVEVASVLDGTAAAGAGLTVGDIIQSVDGEPVTTMDGLVVRLRFHRVGDIATLSIARGDEVLRLNMELLERPEGV